MKRVLILLCLALAIATPAAAQTCSGRACTGAITATNASCIKTACVALNLGTNIGSATFTITGTFVATVSFEAAGDGVNFVAINCYPSSGTQTAATTATAVGTWVCNLGGYAEVRARASAYTSGTATVSINSSAATSPR